MIRMLHNWLGAEPFRKGLALYLKRHQYKNALTEDLWAALEESSGQPVNKVFVVCYCCRLFSVHSDSYTM